MLTSEQHDKLMRILRDHPLLNKYEFAIIQQEPKGRRSDDYLLCEIGIKEEFNTEILMFEIRFEREGTIILSMYFCPHYNEVDRHVTENKIENIFNIPVLKLTHWNIAERELYFGFICMSCGGHFWYNRKQFVCEFCKDYKPLALEVHIQDNTPLLNKHVIQIIIGYF
jgi:hypothetical protein